MRALTLILALTLTLTLTGCTSAIDDERIPAMPVNIKLDNMGLWNTYGTPGYGMYRYFSRERKEPANFPYTQTTYTGFGGVLLIGGMDPFTADTNVPLAYDMSCPVECKSDIVVYIDDDNLDAVCPVCGSHYNVTMGNGAPLSGPALTGPVKFKLQSYRCIPQPLGGYIITR